jgi:hypothetical protein
MQDLQKRFPRGTRVTCNGNPNARVLDPYYDGMVNVRLFDGLRHVGDVCVGYSQLAKENPV